MNNPYFNVKAQTVRSRRTYEKRIVAVFREVKSRFLDAYEIANRTILTEELLQQPIKRNPLARALRTRSLHKVVTQSEWERIAEFSLADLEPELHSKLVQNVRDEAGFISKEVARNIVKLHARVKIDPNANLLPRHALDFLDEYELQLSASTKRQVDGRLKNIIREGLVRGSSNQDIRDEIVKAFDTLTKKHAFTIARSETIRASGEGSKAAYTAAGIAQVDLLPALDACPICVDLAHENPYPVDDREIALPIHPNCRCTIVPIVAGRSVFDDTLYPDTFETDGGNATFTEQ